MPYSDEQVMHYLQHNFAALQGNMQAVLAKQAEHHQVIGGLAHHVAALDATLVAHQNSMQTICKSVDILNDNLVFCAHRIDTVSGGQNPAAHDAQSFWEIKEVLHNGFASVEVLKQLQLKTLSHLDNINTTLLLIWDPAKAGQSGPRTHPRTTTTARPVAATQKVYRGTVDRGVAAVPGTSPAARWAPP